MEIPRGGSGSFRVGEHIHVLGGDAPKLQGTEAPAQGPSQPSPCVSLHLAAHLQPLPRPLTDQ